jgi:hypothetical protein
MLIFAAFEQSWQRSKQDISFVASSSLQYPPVHILAYQPSGASKDAIDLDVFPRLAWLRIYAPKSHSQNYPTLFDTHAYESYNLSHYPPCTIKQLLLIITSRRYITHGERTRYVSARSLRCQRNSIPGPWSIVSQKSECT